jgi:hypothetical protein
MKSAILFAGTLAIGAVVGMILQRSPAELQHPIRASSSPSQAPRLWNESEDDTRRRMAAFQDRLDRLETQPIPDTVETLARDMEAQRGIDDILIKYREAQQSKFSVFVSAIGALVGAVIGAVGGWVAAKRTVSAPGSGRVG